MIIDAKNIDYDMAKRLNNESKKMNLTTSEKYELIKFKYKSLLTFNKIDYKTLDYFYNNFSVIDNFISLFEYSEIRFNKLIKNTKIKNVTNIKNILNILTFNNIFDEKTISKDLFIEKIPLINEYIKNNKNQLSNLYTN